METLPPIMPDDPLPLAERWLDDAWERSGTPNPNAMALATVDAEGRPAARIVLLKGLDSTQGVAVFFTNYHSRKGRELTACPRAAAVLHWDLMHRQLRLEGRIDKLPAADSDSYYQSRPWQSRVGAWASHQSEPIASREALLEQVRQTAERLGTPPLDSTATQIDVHLERPPHWGGYRLWLTAIEFWVEGAARVHDRVRYERALHDAAAPVRSGGWTRTRLQP